MVTISDWAFSECRKLSRITIPDSVHDIGEGAFSNCALLDEVEIPDSVTRMDDCGFPWLRQSGACADPGLRKGPWLGTV